MTRSRLAPRPQPETYPLSRSHHSRHLAATLLVLLSGLAVQAKAYAAAPAPKAPTANVALPKQTRAKLEILLAAGLYTRWADAIEPSKDGPKALKVGIVGSDNYFKELQALAVGRQIAGRPVVVRHYPTPQEVESCQILLLTQSLSRSDRLGLIDKYKSAPVLLAGETPGFCGEGGGLNLRDQDGSAKFLLNPQALARQKLTVDPRFARLGQPATAKPQTVDPPSGPHVHPVRQPGSKLPSSGPHLPTGDRPTPPTPRSIHGGSRS